MPVAVWQTPGRWQASAGAQVIGLAPTQLPPWHVSAWLQALPSLHEAPLGFTGLVQIPVAAWQVPIE
jgi:hypothetical protein